MKNFWNSVAAFLVIVLMVSVVSCDKEPTDMKPELPPLESLVMDFSDFNVESSGGTKSTLATYNNIVHAYFSVLFWNAATTVTFAVPVAAYAYAFQQEPVYVGDYNWEWSYDVTVGGSTYTATLTGSRIDNQRFSVELIVAEADNPEAGVKWLEGEVRYDHSQATWHMFKDGKELITIEWSTDPGSGRSNLTYTYVEAGHTENGSYVEWSYNPDEYLDAAYTISFSAGKTFIEWSTETKEGRVKDAGRFGDEDWHCWDTKENGLKDKDCSAG